MRRKWVAVMLAMVAMVVVPATALAKFTLVIDPGHGGHDAGALGAFSKEKDINLSVALAFGRYVERNCPDVKVLYTRKTDVFIPLMDRANVANRNKADLFISVHTNALPKGKVARGFETYTLGMHRAKDNLDVAMRENSVITQEKNYRQTYQGFDPKSSESYIMFELMQSAYMERSVELATMIQRNVCANAGRPNKGVHQAGFLVLRETSMPSCLIELGFITTPDEERLLNDKSQVDAIAAGIYKAFVQYKNKYQGGQTAVGKGDSKAETAQQPAADNGDSDVMTSRQPAPVKGAGEAKAPRQPTGKRNGKTMTARQSDNVDTMPVPARPDKEVGGGHAPVFKVQIFVSNRVLRDGDSHFKGLRDYAYYEENGLYKYTLGASADYNEIYRLRKDILDKFPEAFIIAFKDGKKMDVNQGIREFKQNRNKK